MPSRSLYMLFVMVLMLCFNTGCFIEGLNSFDISTASEVIRDGNTVILKFDQQPAAEGAPVAVVYRDEEGWLAGFGTIQLRHSTQEWELQLRFLNLPGDYENLDKYMAAAFQFTYEKPREFIETNTIHEISYLPERSNMLQLVWTPEEQGGNGVPDLPWHTVLEITEYYQPTPGPGQPWEVNWSNTCQLDPIFDSLMCRLYGIGGVGGTQWHNVVIEVVKE